MWLTHTARATPICTRGKRPRCSRRPGEVGKSSEAQCLRDQCLRDQCLRYRGLPSGRGRSGFSARAEWLSTRAVPVAPREPAAGCCTVQHGRLPAVATVAPGGRDKEGVSHGRALPVRPDPDAEDSGRTESGGDSARAESSRRPAARPGAGRDLNFSTFVQAPPLLCRGVPRATRTRHFGSPPLDSGRGLSAERRGAPA